MEKKTEQLQAAAEKAAKQKLDAAQTALKEAEKANDGEDTGGEKIRLKVRNKTGRPTYYRSGLCFAQVDAEYEVAKDVADILLVDPWLIIEEVK